MKEKTEISPITVGKIMQDFTGKRVAKEAKEETVKVLEELVDKITKKANLLAQNENRITLKGKDIRYSYQQIKMDR